jgi:hypothetical protein
MTDTVKENLVQPRAAVGARFEALKGSPCLKLDFLNRIFCVAAISRHPQRYAEEIVEVRHSLNLKPIFSRAASLLLGGQTRRRFGPVARKWRMSVPGPTSHRL